MISGLQVLVSGTPGGVGSVATLLLAQLGYHVVAVTGPDNSGRLMHSHWFRSGQILSSHWSRSGQILSSHWLTQCHFIPFL